ncbi:hypothetical protein K502DRAFT_323160 [Neoconidiobolus thromboides FSU 785]|nr:hypothetical protein K502DRAFT_323160 [Neoconidiobolus thromboides FSU 785]
MDEFLQEIKKQHEAEEIIRSNFKYQNSANFKQFQTYSNPLKKKPEIAQKAVVENGDPTSTCLYLGNISSELNEEIICQNFGAFGAIASVKITVPRNLEEGSRVRPCAFVSFMDRESAVSAKNVMDGTVLLGQTLKIGWGKPIIIPEKPFYDASDKSKVIKTGNPFNARTVASAEVSADFKAVQFSYGRAPQPFEGQNKNVLRLEVQVKIPQDRTILKLIHQTIEYVLLYGYDFEGHLLQKEANNEKYQFLYDTECDEHIYYRWKLYSLLQGDLVDSWRTESFRIFEDGPYFIPPPLSGSNNRTHTLNKVKEVSLPYDSDDSDVVNRKGHNVEKKENEVDEWVGFFKQLNELNLDRNRIGLAMVFALEHVSQSEKLVGMIRSALIKEGNELNKSLAILYLISDILYNLSPTVPQAWKLRACIEQHLEAFFKHVHSQYRGIVARLKAESFRRQFAVLLELWESSLILPTTFLSRLTNLLNHGQPELPQELTNVVQHNPIYQDNLDAPEGIIEEKIEVVKPKAVKKSNKKRSRKITQVLEEDEDLDMFG